MPTTIKKMYQGQPSTSIGTHYTVPASTKSIIKQIVICNTTAATATVTIHVVANGGSNTAANMITNALPVGANDTITLDLSVVMDTAGDTIRALQGTSSAITLTISGVEFT